MCPYLLGTPHSHSALKPAAFPALLEQRDGGPVCPLIPISQPQPRNEVPLCLVLLNVTPPHFPSDFSFLKPAISYLDDEDLHIFISFV